MWDLSSPTRDRTLALGSESVESQPLDRQGIPSSGFFDLSKVIHEAHTEQPLAPTLDSSVYCPSYCCWYQSVPTGHCPGRHLDQLGLLLSLYCSSPSHVPRSCQISPCKHRPEHADPVLKDRPSLQDKSPHSWSYSFKMHLSPYCVQACAEHVLQHVTMSLVHTPNIPPSPGPLGFEVPGMSTKGTPLSLCLCCFHSLENCSFPRAHCQR